MSKHEKIELIVLTVCKYYGVYWKSMYKRAVTGEAHKARKVVVELVKEMISQSAPHEYLKLTHGVMNNLSQQMLPKEYHKIRDSILNVIELNKAA